MPYPPHSFFMERAILLAEKGRGHTAPNPVVGALVVKNGSIVAEGYHGFFGGPHAEVEALRRAGSASRGSTLYVNLEPCSTYGKTPPCTRLLKERGIRHVVLASQDPNPLHRGRGIQELRRHGIRVTSGILGGQARRQNEIFFKWVITGLPFVAVKMAETLDGKIAARGGESRWITGKEARQRVHRLRGGHQAVLVGARTALIDNPRLDVRIRGAVQPVRIVIDRKLSVPLTHRLFRTGDGKIIVITGETAFKRNFSRYERRNIGLLAVRSANRRLDLGDLLAKLAQMGISSLLVEGGGETAARFLEERLVDKIYFFVAPKILGGKEAVSPVEGIGITSPNQAIRIRDLRVSCVGEDFLFEGYPKYVQRSTSSGQRTEYAGRCR